TGGLDVVINTATAAWERVEAARLMSVAHGFFSIGVLLGAVSAGLARQGGARPLAILMVIAVVVVVVALTQPTYRRADGDAAQGSPDRLSLVLLGIGVLTAGAFLCEDAVQSWSALHLERGLDASPAVSGLGPGLFAGAMAVGRLGSGFLRIRSVVLFTSAASTLTVGVLVVALAPTAAVALVGLVVAGAGTSVLAPVLYSAVGARAAAGRQGADLARVSALGYVGFCAGPPVVGAVSAATSLPVALGGLAVLSTAMAVCGRLAVRD
ncbi:MAG: major facilitator superfamily transporter, partial [Frankiales bacterium]|nr:major facilitator superfamily transporter [Frankiales bacterium]